MALTDADRLRGLLADMDADAPIISDERLEDLLTQANGDLERAAFEGWRLKAAYYADLVNVTEGNASREMSDLHKNALKMITMYEDSRGGPTEGRTRIGRIVRAT